MAPELASRVAVKTVQTGITAAGTVITDATDLVAEVSVVSSAPASSGVQVWNAPVGTMLLIKNLDSDTINVFPHESAGTFNAGTPGAAVTLAQNKTGMAIRDSSTDWLWIALD